MGNGQISAIRLDDFIDVYATQQDGYLKHYYANPSTSWITQSEILCGGVIGKPAVVRYQNDLDVYVLTQNRSVLHLWTGDQTNWQYSNEILADNVSSPPVAIRWENDIDVYFFDDDGDLVHLWTSDRTDWQYQREVLTKATEHHGLTALRTQSNAIDVYFITVNTIVHLHCGEHNEWEYQLEWPLIGVHAANGYLCATRSENCVNLFYCDGLNRICHAVCGDSTEWTYETRGPISNFVTPKSNEFSVVENENHIDVYCIGYDNCVHHCYCGVNSNFEWQPDEIISTSNAANGLVAIRPYQKAIDVFYLGNNDELYHLFIGEGIGNNWDAYQSELSLPVLQWEDIRDSARLIGEGYHGFAYLIDWNSERIVVKKFKTPNQEIIRAEVKILEKLSTIWPGYCKAFVFENGNLVGFAMLYFEGKKLDDALQDKENIFHRSATARIKLIKKFAHCVEQFQNLGICHGDISLDNIILKQNSKSSSDHIDLMVIDFGNGFFFDANTPVVKSYVLTGFLFHLPPEFKTGSPFDPSGINAYQLARVSMQILLLTPFSACLTGTISQNPTKELEKLKDFGFEKPLINVLADGVSSNINARNEIYSALQNTKESGNFGADRNSIPMYTISTGGALDNSIFKDLPPVKNQPDWEGTIREMSQTIIGASPKFGTLLTLVWQFLWPSPETGANEIWDKIKDKVSALIDEKLLEHEFNERKNEIEGIKSNIIQYSAFKKGKKGKSIECGVLLDNIIMALGRLQSKFTGSKNDIHIVRLTVTLATIHLAVLREHYIFGKDLFDEDNSEQSLKNMVRIFDLYKEHFEKVYPKWREYREELIKIDYGNKATLGLSIAATYGKVKDTKVSDDEIASYNLNGSFSKDRFKPVCEAKKRCIFNDINGQFMADYAVWFELERFIPGREKKQPKIDSELGTIEFGPYFEKDYVGKIDFDEEGVTKGIIVREYNSIDALQIIYKSHEGHFVGNPKGGEKHEIELEDNQRIGGIQFGVSRPSGIVAAIAIGIAGGKNTGFLGNRREWGLTYKDVGFMKKFALISMAAATGAGPSGSSGITQLAFRFRHKYCT